MPMRWVLLSEELDRRAARLQGDDGLLPVGQPADAEAEPPLLALAVLGADLGDPDPEQLLGGVLDLVLGRPGVDLKRVSRRPVFLALLAVVLRLVRALLGDQRPQDDLVRLELRAPRPGRFRVG